MLLARPLHPVLGVDGASQAAPVRFHLKDEVAPYMCPGPDSWVQSYQSNRILRHGLH